MNYQKIYNQIIERARIKNLTDRKKQYFETHHIIPRCIGGLNDKFNLVNLTAREHFLCHRILIEIYPNKKNLKLAFWKMLVGGSKNQQRNYQVSSREFERVKEEMSKINSVIQSKRWRNDNLRKEHSKKISTSQLKSYQENPNRAKKLSNSQTESYRLDPGRVIRLSNTQISRYKNTNERIKTGIAVKKSKTPTLLKKMSKRFLGKRGNQWKGYVYIYNPKGALEYKFESKKETIDVLGNCIIKHNRIGKKGKYKGYKFIISKDEL